MINLRKLLLEQIDHYEHECFKLTEKISALQNARNILDNTFTYEELIITDKKADRVTDKKTKLVARAKKSKPITEVKRTKPKNAFGQLVKK